MNSKEVDIIRRCAGCDATEKEAVLFDIKLPPLIKHKQYLCKPCLSTAIDNSKKKAR
jgi:hypothetical protein